MPSLSLSTETDKSMVAFLPKKRLYRAMHNSTNSVATFTASHLFYVSRLGSLNQREECGEKEKNGEGRASPEF